MHAGVQRFDRRQIPEIGAGAVCIIKPAPEIVSRICRDTRPYAAVHYILKLRIDFQFNNCVGSVVQPESEYYDAVSARLAVA
jgi:hypothetical protein